MKPIDWMVLIFMVFCIVVLLFFSYEAEAQPVVEELNPPTRLAEQAVEQVLWETDIAINAGDQLVLVLDLSSGSGHEGQGSAAADYVKVLLEDTVIGQRYGKINGEYRVVWPSDGSVQGVLRVVGLVSDIVRENYTLRRVEYEMTPIVKPDLPDDAVSLALPADFSRRDNWGDDIAAIRNDRQTLIVSIPDDLSGDHNFYVELVGANYEGWPVADIRVVGDDEAAARAFVNEVDSDTPKLYNLGPIDLNSVHTVTIDMVEDNYGGSPSRDRDLGVVAIWFQPVAAEPEEPTDPVIDPTDPDLPIIDVRPHGPFDFTAAPFTYSPEEIQGDITLWQAADIEGDQRRTAALEYANYLAERRVIALERIASAVEWIAAHYHPERP